MFNVAKIDEALKVLAINKRYRFNAQQVAYLSGNNDVNEVYQYLCTREPYVLEKSYEVLCPDRMDSAAKYSKIDKIPKGWIECRICGREFIPDENLIHIVFSFTSSYLEQVEKEINDEKKMRRPLMATC
ncbi:hypothetical protein [Bacillus toyonensis]|uniref:hypothetical protein n=1 Tax=Bacillus toyonensis TaxID=155322 RepID=UPI0011A17C88|nr:hypothetical protein [Bacillus toyonensis]